MTGGVILACLAGIFAAQPEVSLAPPGIRAARGLGLKAGTAVPLSLVGAISSQTHGQGDRVELAVADDVLVGGKIIIPRGAAALGEIVRHTAKGAYGKAGKLELRLLHVTVGGRRIRLDGGNEHEGANAAVPAIASGIVTGIFGAIITGKTAVIPAGTRMTGYVHRDLPLASTPAGATPN